VKVLVQLLLEDVLIILSILSAPVQIINGSPLHSQVYVQLLMLFQTFMPYKLDKLLPMLLFYVPLDISRKLMLVLLIPVLSVVLLELLLEF
jgi:hypothetical protein